MTNETTEHLAIAVDIYLTTPKGQSGLILERLFTDDEVVHDDGRNYVGLDAIGAWDPERRGRLLLHLLHSHDRRCHASGQRDDRAREGEGYLSWQPSEPAPHLLLADEGSAY